MNGRSVARAVDVRQQLAKILRERLKMEPEVGSSFSLVSLSLCVCVSFFLGGGFRDARFAA